MLLVFESTGSRSTVAFGRRVLYGRMSSISTKAVVLNNNTGNTCANKVERLREIVQKRRINKKNIKLWES